jgi:hypothetical protein
MPADDILAAIGVPDGSDRKPLAQVLAEGMEAEAGRHLAELDAQMTPEERAARDTYVEARDAHSSLVADMFRGLETTKDPRAQELLDLAARDERAHSQAIDQQEDPAVRAHRETILGLLGRAPLPDPYPPPAEPSGFDDMSARLDKLEERWGITKEGDDADQD